MSWDSKTDYCGLANTSLVIKSSNQNNAASYLEKAGKSGAIAATKVYGELAAPSCEYAIKAAGTVSVQIGAVTTVDDKRYALANVHYENGADAEPTFTATSQQIEDTSDGTTRVFEAITVSFSPDEAAEILQSAFTLAGSECELTKCALDISGSVKNHTVNGDPVASDVTMGRMTISVEILQCGSTVPTITEGTGWDISSPLSCSDPDADFPVWTATLSKPLNYAS